MILREKKIVSGNREGETDGVLNPSPPPAFFHFTVLNKLEMLFWSPKGLEVVALRGTNGFLIEFKGNKRVIQKAVLIKSINVAPDGLRKRNGSFQDIFFLSKFISPPRKSF